jgi:hypothetical protein
MNEPLPECCGEFQITNRAELIDCLTALEDTNDMTIESLIERQHSLDIIHGIDHRIMFVGDQELEDIYDHTRLTIQRRIDELRRIRATE